MLRDAANYIVGLVATKTQWILAALLAYITAWWQNAPPPAQKLFPLALILVVLDTILGGMVAALSPDKQFSSRGINRALIKVFTYLMAMLVAMVIDHGLGIGYFTVNIVAGLMFYREAASCVENLERLGLPLPVVRKRLQALRQETETLNDPEDNDSEAGDPQEGDGEDRDSGCDG